MIARMVAALCAAASVALAGAGYSVAVIPNPPGMTETSVYALNNSGQVVGWGYMGAQYQPFIGSVSGSTAIPAPAGTGGATAYGINDLGQIVGLASLGHGNTQAFIATTAGSTLIPLLSGQPSSSGYSINNSGQVAGFVSINGPPARYQAFIGAAAGSTLVPRPPDAIYTYAYAINASGQVAGSTGCDCSGVPQNVVIGTATSVLEIVPPAFWLQAQAVAINASAQVAGTYSFTTDGTPFSFFGNASGLTQIPLPPGGTYMAVSYGALNDSGQVVGLTNGGGFIWDSSHGTQLLSNLVPAGWTVADAFSINNNGQIAAYASNSITGVSGNVVLTPSCQLTVPSISQSGAQTQSNPGGTWGALPYGHLTGTTIAGRGSALTSLNMGLNSLGQSWNPGTLNSLLDSAPDGYTPAPSSAVNWLPATAAANSGTAGSPVALDDLGGWVNSDVNLTQAISTVEKGICGAGLPVIAAVRSPHSNNYPGHFVLVTGQIVNPDGSMALTINDPAYPATVIGTDQATANSGYTNPTTGKPEFWTRGVVRQPVDLTGLSVSAGPSVNLLITDPNGLQAGYMAGSSNPLQNIPNSGAGVDEIDDDVTGAAGSPVQGVLINSPAAGTFQFSLTGTAAGPYSLQVAAEASDGSVQSFSFSGLTNVGTALTYQLVYSSTPGAVTQPVLLGPCNITNTGSLNAADVQLLINEALGLAKAANDLSGDGRVNVVDVQIEIGAALGVPCTAQ